MTATTTEIIKAIAVLPLDMEVIDGLAALLEALGKLDAAQVQRVCWAAVGMAAMSLPNPKGVA